MNDNTLDPDLGNLADPRIQALAKEAKARGWDYRFVSNNHRFELHVEPKINRECHLVLGFAVSERSAWRRRHHMHCSRRRYHY